MHINSGIPNHAFYLAATALGGNAWERAGQIWYDVLTRPGLAKDVDFAGLRGGDRRRRDGAVRGRQPPRPTRCGRRG